MGFFNVFAFGIGMVALINPCGFGLLPAYLGLFLGQEDNSRSKWISLNRAQVVGLAMTLGMILAFGFFGFVFGAGQETIQRVIPGFDQGFLPYFNILLGFGLVILGIAMLRGYQLTLKLPKIQKGGTSGSFASMFLFGLSYATASVTCTLPIFLIAINSGNIGSPAGERSFVADVGSLVSYGIGMGLLATMITLLLALGKTSIVGNMRSLLPKINKISAVLLILVGPYSIGYGIWELQVLGHGPFGDMPWAFLDSINLGVADIQASVSQWFGAEVSIFGRMTSRTSLLGWPFVAINAMVIIGGFIARRRLNASGGDTPTTTNDSGDNLQAAA